MNEEFQVTDEVVIEGLSEVKETKATVPAASAVLFRVSQAATDASPDGSVKRLNVTAVLVEGIDTPEKDEAGSFTGQVVKKFQNKPMFIRVPYWADTTVRTKAWYTAKNRPFLVPFKQLISALGYDVKEKVILNDQLLSEIIGREFRADIRLRPAQAKNPETGAYEDIPGEFNNEVVKFKAA